MTIKETEEAFIEEFNKVRREAQKLKDERIIPDKTILVLYTKYPIIQKSKNLLDIERECGRYNIYVYYSSKHKELQEKKSQEKSNIIFFASYRIPSIDKWGEITFEAVAIKRENFLTLSEDIKEQVVIERNSKKEETHDEVTTDNIAITSISILHEKKIN